MSFLLLLVAASFPFRATRVSFRFVDDVISVVVLNVLFILLVQVRVVVARATLAVALETKISFSYFVFKVVKRKM